MSIPHWNPAGDLPELADHQETVTVTLPVGTQHTVAGALRRAARKRPATSGSAAAASTDLVWHLPRAQLPVAPPLGTLITAADGQNWTVVRVVSAALNTRWLLTARSLQLQGLLADRIHLLAATFSKDSHGAPQATWRTVQAHVRARVQRVAAAAATSPRYRVILLQALAWPLPLRVQQPLGNRTFRVTAVEREEALPGLTVLEAQKL